MKTRPVFGVLSMKISPLFLAVLAMSALLHAADNTAEKNPLAGVSPQNLYGVIEIGGSGVKPMLFEKKGGKVLFLKNYEVTEADAFSWTASSSGLVAETVQDVVQKMETDAKVPDDHFDIVGSSGVPSDVRPTLTDSIMQKLHLKVSYITIEQESQLVFRNIVPADQVGDVVVLDIGSGNSKGSYADVRDDGLRLASFGIPFGTKTFAQKIDDERHDGAFAITAESLREQFIQPAIRDDVAIAPGMQHRPRIYLVGGIAWSMALVTHPFEMKQTLIKLTPHEIDSFLDKAISSPREALQPDLAQAPHQPTENVAAARSKATGAIAKIGDVFTDNQLVAGAILLKSYLAEMGYHGRDVYFYTQALYAWPQQYIIDATADQGSK